MKASVFITLLAATAALHAEPVQGVVSPNKQISLSSPVMQEVITEMLVEEGTEVREGQVVAQLHNDREKLDVRLSEKLIQLKQFIARGQQRLYREKMGSEEKALEAQTDLELAQLQLESKKIALSEKTVRTPLGGIVVKKYKEAGESIDRAEKLVDIVNIDQVNVQFYLKPELRKTLTQDAPIRVRILDLEGKDFDGKITFVDPRNDAASGLVRVKVKVENADHHIKPGMKGSADFGK